MRVFVEPILTKSKEDTTHNRRTVFSYLQSKEAVTEFTVLERFQDYTLVECRLITGRTHQIRVHFSYIGFPVVGDPVYGTRKQIFSIEGQALHAHQLSFTHPRTKETITCVAPIPADMEEILNQLRK